MKRFLLPLLLVGVCSTVALAQPARGRRVLSGFLESGYSNQEQSPSNSKVYRLNSSLGYGWFVNDNWLITPAITGSYFESTSDFSNTQWRELNRSIGLQVSATRFSALAIDKFYFVTSGTLSYQIGNLSNSTFQSGISFNSNGYRNDYEIGLSAGLGYSLSERWFLQANLASMNFEYSNVRRSNTTSHNTTLGLSSLLNNFGLSVFYFLR